MSVLLSHRVLLERLLERVEPEERAFDAYGKLAHAGEGAQVTERLRDRDRRFKRPLDALPPDEAR
jgi:hypothetical protein